MVSEGVTKACISKQWKRHEDGICVHWCSNGEHKVTHGAAVLCKIEEDARVLCPFCEIESEEDTSPDDWN